MKTKCTTTIIAAVAAAFLLTGSITAFGQAEVDDLKAKMKAMEKMMQEMQQKIADLEKQKAAPAPTATPPAPVPPGEAAKVTLQPQTREIVGHASPIQDRQTLNNQQEAAQRPNDLTLDPQYNGFIPVPNTLGLIRFNAKPRLDLMSDNRNSGDAERFITARIPVRGDSNRGDGEQFNMNAKGSQLSVDVRAPDMPGNFRFYYNNDFFGSGSSMAYRLKQLYGQLYNVTVGFTFSVFEDPDIWPDNVDYEGPNTALFARQPTVRYLLALNDHWQINFGLQQPGADIDDNPNIPALAGGSANNQAPDGGFNIRWEDKKVGHVQFATIARYLGVRDAGATGDIEENAMGWGINLSAGINTIGRDSMQLQFTYGEGIFRFVNDNFENNDAVLDSDGDLVPIPYFGIMAGYTHHWSDRWRSTATFGYANLDNEGTQTGDAYHETYYGSLNLIWQLRKRLSVGIEGLYGRKETNDGDTGDVFRAQVGMVYSLFD